MDIMLIMSSICMIIFGILVEWSIWDKNNRGEFMMRGVDCVMNLCGGSGW